MSFNSDNHRKTIIESKTFKAKNYKNSPFIREFYRFIAKNSLRSEAFKIVNRACRVRPVVHTDYVNETKN